MLFQFPPSDQEGFYDKLVSEQETTALVPTIEAREAQATVESDRVRIFKEITESIGMEIFNEQLQTNLERALRAVATETLLQRGVVETVSAAGGKATIGLLRDELQSMKQLLAKVQEEQATTWEVQEAKEETTKELRQAKTELAVLAAGQEEANQRVAALETKLDTVLELLAGRGVVGAGA